MDVRDVAEALLSGEVAIVPTDTVYGLAARPDQPGAVRKLFELKGRPADKAIPILGYDVRSLAKVARFDEPAIELARRYWPGSVTVVLDRAPGFDADLGGTEPATVAVRIPDRPITLELLKLTGPLAVTSANRSGEPPCTDAIATSQLWPDVALLDDGPARGQPSTIVSLIGAPTVIRAGAVDGRRVLASLMGHPTDLSEES